MQMRFLSKFTDFAYIHTDLIFCWLLLKKTCQNQKGQKERRGEEEEEEEEEGEKEDGKTGGKIL